MKKYKNCQSYGTPLKNTPNGGGTDADGSTSAMYCAHCYECGTFKQPEVSADEMQEFVKRKMKDMGFPGFIAGFFVKGIPKLERWNRS